MSHIAHIDKPKKYWTPLLAVSLAALTLSGCATVHDTGPLESQIAEVRKGDFGMCMEGSYLAAVELKEAQARLAELKAGSPSDTDLREGMRAAKAAAELRDQAERQCATEYRLANKADAAQIAMLEAQLAAISERLQQIENKREILRGVTFATGSATLSRSAKVMLDVQADKLAQEEDRIQVAGYASSIGSAEHNLQLSTKRATAVRAYLVTRGIKPDMIVAKGFGIADPVASNDTESGRRANQRIELHYLE